MVGGRVLGGVGTEDAAASRLLSLLFTSVGSTPFKARQSCSLAVALATHQPEKCAISGLKLCVRDPDRDGSPGKK